MIEIRIAQTIDNHIGHERKVQELVNAGYEILFDHVIDITPRCENDGASQFLYSTMLRKAPRPESPNLASVVEVQGLKIDVLRSLFGGIEQQLETIQRHLKLVEPAFDHPTDLHTLPGLSRLELVLEEIEADKAAGR